MDLIPDLPYDIAFQCLLRLSYNQYRTASSVCKSWNRQIRLPEFLRQRKAGCHSQKLVVMTQAKVDPNINSGFVKRLTNPVYRVSVLEVGSGLWSELPPIPGFFSSGFPLFCQVVAVGSDLVVMGGLDPVTWKVSGLVFVFDFVSATWRRGADMPGVRRLLFGCASDGDRMVYVAGGHDDEKNALRSAMAYDVEKNEWTNLPDMTKERDECKGVFRSGKFHVIGGYSTNAQGRFERDAEAFDVENFQWGQVQENFLKSASCPRTCTGGDDEDLHMCHKGQVIALKGDTWQEVSKVPTEVSSVAYVTTWQGKLMVIGHARFGEPHMGYVLDLKSYEWTKIETPKEFSGHVQSGCYSEI
ncbi:F-box/kelch-repeat protein At1g80440-like [Mangifera indica]|uniref:F-box/kelch-repeat protein At1g80440-like n=1 Tax=Mangifera indica TaxID=29780 RepID=UPI001CF9CFA7|nr:F-box/kelch-repeat protein At1g80440-like [Mangifera indica]